LSYPKSLELVVGGKHVVFAVLGRFLGLLASVGIDAVFLEYGISSVVNLEAQRQTLGSA
jgi:hypothetical protein